MTKFHTFNSALRSTPGESGTITLLPHLLPSVLSSIKPGQAQTAVPAPPAYKTMPYQKRILLP